MTATDTTSIPNAARVYDYLLGGHHNFEPDRRAAEVMVELVPSTRRWVRRLRAFLHKTVLELADDGFDRFLDLASGLPTEEHIHSSVPSARVVYVDSDPVVVGYGGEILDGSPRARYIQADIRDPAAIVESAVVKEMLGDARKVAIGLNAVTCFLTEGEIRKIAQTMYDWAPPGSRLFATFETKAEGMMTPKMQQLVDMFDQMGSPYRFLTLETSQEVVGPWSADSRGFRPLAEVLGVGEVPIEDREGVDLEFYGAVLVK